MALPSKNQAPTEPPVTLSVDAAGIPAELKARRQFVGWRWIWRGDRWTKPPYQIARPDKKAKSNAPETWATFADAWDAYYLEDVPGIGYVVSPDDPYCFIDLDKCVDAESGEIVEEAAEIIASFPGAYIERSVSGTGIHILTRGSIPGDRHTAIANGFKVEIYDRERFMTLTGQLWTDLPADGIALEQDAIDAFYERYFPAKPEPESAPAPARTFAPHSDADDAWRLAKARAASNGAAFASLYDHGDLSAHSNDRNRADQALANHLAFWLDANPSRIDRAFRLSALMRPKWDEVHRGDGATYGQMTIEKAVAACPQPWEPRVKLHVLPRVERADDEDDGEPDTQLAGFALTDLGNAERLAAQHGQELRYCHEMDRWYIWDGARFGEDRAGGIVARAKQTVRAIYREAAVADDKDERKAIVKHGQASEQAARIAAMVNLARSEPGIPVTVDQLDQDPWVLNVRYGVVDLRTGALRPHNQHDMLTKLAPVVYDNTAECPRFLSFLRRAMDGDEALVTFLQRAIGYSLTGVTVERIILILYGEGKNGKSTLLEVVRAILGDYALRTPTETLLAKREQGIPNDIARLRGMRFVSASEAEEGQRLAEAKIKDLTGGDVISARFMRGEYFDFLPTFKIWLSTNHKPVIRGTDRAIWDRIRLVPFLVRIPPDEQDKHLREKLISEAPGILAWAVQGCLDWQREGLTEPAGVSTATEGYRAEMDVLGEFIAECCVTGDAEQSTAFDLYSAYQKWCEASGEFYVTKTAFGKRLSERGFDNARTGKKQSRTWIGIGLRNDSSDF
jgi:putative DNA primase/helicase